MACPTSAQMAVQPAIGLLLRPGKPRLTLVSPLPPCRKHSMQQAMPPSAADAIFLFRYSTGNSSRQLKQRVHFWNPIAFPMRIGLRASKPRVSAALRAMSGRAQFSEVVTSAVPTP